jgi:hypothetical protein
VKQSLLIVTLLLLSIGLSFAQGASGYIAYSGQGANSSDIFVADLATGEVRNLTDNPVRSDHPTWSNDGSKIAFNNVLEGDNIDIFIMDANGLNQMNLSNHPAVDVSPDWSPVANEIVFSSNRDGGYDLYLMNVDSGQVERLTSDGIDKNHPAWSSDGRRIAYWQSENGAYALKILNRTDGSISTLISKGENLWPAWSPDDRYIVVHSNETGSSQIFLVNVEEASRLQLTNNAANNFRPAFSPDGTQIVFVSNINGNNDLFMMNLDGTEQRPFLLTDGDDSSPDWRPVAPEIDFDANPNLGQSAVRVSGDSVESNEVLGQGRYRVFAPQEANYQDFIRIRLEIELEDIETIPEEDLPPLREQGDVSVYRYMGAQLTGIGLEDFQIFPDPTAYLLQMQADEVNYWEWYLQPLGAEVVGEKLLFVEIYLPDIGEDGLVTQSMLKRIPISLSIVSAEPSSEISIEETSSDTSVSYDPSFTQTGINPQQEAEGFSVYLNSENLLAISFSQAIDVSTMTVASGSANYSLSQLFPDIEAVYASVAPANFCVMYERDGSSDAVPLACQVETRLSRSLNPGDIFWYNNLARSLQDVIIRKADKTYVCSARLERCDF